MNFHVIRNKPSPCHSPASDSLQLAVWESVSVTLAQPIEHNLSTLKLPLDEADLGRLACDQDVSAPLTVPFNPSRCVHLRATDSPVSAAPTPVLIVPVQCI